MSDDPGSGGPFRHIGVTVPLSPAGHDRYSTPAPGHMAISRRTAMKLAGGIAVGSLTVSTGARSGVAQQSFPIQPASPDFPMDQVTIRMLVQGTGPRSAFYREFFPAYQAARPNVTIEAQELPANEIQQLLPLAVQNRNAPDIFMLGGALTTGRQSPPVGWPRSTTSFRTSNRGGPTFPLGCFSKASPHLVERPIRFLSARTSATAQWCFSTTH